jgi:phosphate/sulfate permease
MLSFLSQGSPAILGLLIVCLVLALAFEFSNGFHDAANAVATVIYTNSLKPTYAVVWSGLMNLLGVILGGIAVAYALVELIPPDVLSPPDGGLAVGMLAALFISALFWNVGTWWFGIPNSSSHALIGALVGIAIESSLVQGRGFVDGVDWHQVGNVLASLLVSPILGFVLALLLFRLMKLILYDKRLYVPPKGDQPLGSNRAPVLARPCRRLKEISPGSAFQPFPADVARQWLYCARYSHTRVSRFSTSFPFSKAAIEGADEAEGSSPKGNDLRSVRSKPRDLPPVSSIAARSAATAYSE